MHAIKKVLLAVALLLPFTSLNAALSIGTAATFNGITWSFSSNTLTSCSRLQLDFIGDITNASALSANGVLQCSSGTYGVTGGLFLTSTGYFMTVAVGAGRWYTCDLGRSSLSGPCTSFDGAGFVTGSGFMSLL